MKLEQHDLTLEWLSLIYCKPKQDFMFSLIKGDTKLRLPSASAFIKYHNPESWNDYRRKIIEASDLPDISLEFEDALDALGYAHELINFVWKRKINLNSDIIQAILRRDLPYQVDGYMLVNRDYNPVGSNYGRRYSDHSKNPNLKNNFKSLMQYDLRDSNFVDSVFWRNLLPSVSRKQDKEPITGYLFFDGNAPWHSKNSLLTYQNRLYQLIRWVIEQPEKPYVPSADINAAYEKIKAELALKAGKTVV